jgi:Tfp pilus assembly pilus retraction ATPase PilT
MLICGATGSGKSSTMAACVGNYLKQRAGKVITFEAPVEVLYQQDMGLVQQHEVGPLAASGDIADFLTATVAAMRDAPNVIKIGEIREMSVLREAVAVAETGHLVIGTMHTGNAMSSISRLIGAAEDDAFLQKLGTKLLGVLCQRLVRVPGGRLANYELLLGCPALTGAITNRRPLDVANVMTTSADTGHFTFAQHMITLVQAKKITPAEAIAQAPLPESMLKLLITKQILTENDPKTKELRKLYAL